MKTCQPRTAKNDFINISFLIRAWGGLLVVISSFFMTTRPSLAQPLKLNPDKSKSHITALVEKAGVLGFLGHNHGVLAQNWSAKICLDQVNPRVSKVKMTIPVKDLVIDTPKARKHAGIEDDGKPSDEDIKEIQAEMLSKNVLDAGKHPEITFTSKNVEIDGEDFEIKADLNLHGVTKEVETKGTLKDDGKTVTFKGEFEIDIEDYGIDFSGAAGGAITIDDDVTFNYTIVGKKTKQACN